MSRSNRLCAITLAALASLALGACAYEGTYTCVRHAAAVGEACGPELDCADGSSCVDGVCRRWGELGDACDREVGLYCRSPYECVSGLCAGNQLGDSEECDPEDEAACREGLACLRQYVGHRCLPFVGAGEGCEADAQCPDGLFCAEGRVCGEGPGVDEPCTLDSGCAEGLSCVQLGYRDVCRPSPRGAGDLCGWPDGCPDGLTCLETSDDGTHGCVADLPEGAPCEPIADAPRCQAGTYCSRETEICERLGAEGDRCSSDDRVDEACEEGLFCQPTEAGAHRCLPPAEEGESCLEGQRCGANTHCDRDRAAPEPSFSLAP